MTMLTNKVRDEVRAKLLKETFEPLFLDLRNHIAQYVREWLHAEHPVFEGLLSRKDASSYLDKRQIYAFKINGSYVATPGYSDSVSNPRVTINEVFVPSSEAYTFTINDPQIIREHRALWDRYKSAHSELTKVLFAYRTRKKLIADFPEYEKYLPVIQIKNLPALTPEIFRARLSALGIPVCDK